MSSIYFLCIVTMAPYVVVMRAQSQRSLVKCISTRLPYPLPHTHTLSQSSSNLAAISVDESFSQN